MKNFPARFSQDDVMYNTMMKTYLDGSKQILCATKRIFRIPGYVNGEVYKLNLNALLDRFAQKADDWWQNYSSEVLKIEYDDYSPPEEIENFLGMSEQEMAEREFYKEMRQREKNLQTSAPEQEEASEEEKKKQRANLRRSIRRAKVKVRDYCLSTAMTWFVTLTLDETKIDRHDIKVITKALHDWLNNLVKRYGLCYVMVPELHKDGAIHFHAIINDVLEVVDSGTIIPRGEDKPRRPMSVCQRKAWLRNGGRIVYNLPQWPYGFTTALKMEGNYEKVVNYVCKYISKGLSDDPGDVVPTKVGGRWYYSGGKLGLPELEFCNNNMEDLEEILGDAARRVDVEDLEDVELIVAWIDADGTAREMPKPKAGGGGKEHGRGKP